MSKLLALKRTSATVAKFAVATAAPVPKALWGSVASAQIKKASNMLIVVQTKAIVPSLRCSCPLPESMGGRGKEKRAQSEQRFRRRPHKDSPEAPRVIELAA